MPDSPQGPRNSIFVALLSLLSKVIGQLQWKPPEWIPWTGRRIRDACRYMIADRRRIVATGASLVVAAGGLAWYELHPRPHYVTYDVTAPKLTVYDDKGVASIAPLAIEFGEPAAPLASFDKVASGLEISPKFAGKWVWMRDQTLQFSPASDWPVDASFTVKFARKGLFAAGVELENYTFESKTEPFTATMSGQ